MEIFESIYGPEQVIFELGNFIVLLTNLLPC